MRKSIKIMAGTRVAAALLAVILFSILTTQNIYKMEDSSEANIAVNALLQRAQKAEAAHYKWSSNLSNALYNGSEFTGSTDPTGCVLGQWLYGEAGTEDQTILDLRNQLELCTSSCMSRLSMCWSCMQMIPRRRRRIIRKPL